MPAGNAYAGPLHHEWDEAAYAALTRQSAKVSPFTYRSVSPDLFEHIVKQHIAPGPGPEPTAPPAPNKGL